MKMKRNLSGDVMFRDGNQTWIVHVIKDKSAICGSTTTHKTVRIAKEVMAKF